MKVYKYFDLNDNIQLQEKVFVDIMIYFWRRGIRHLREPRMDHFAARTDPDGRLYVYIKSDELTKNQQEDNNTADGRMYSIKARMVLS